MPASADRRESVGTFERGSVRAWQRFSVAAFERARFVFALARSRTFTLRRSHAPTLPRSHTLTLTLIVLVTTAGCRQDMHNQPKYKPLKSSAFFEDGRDSRPLIADTVARGHLDDDALLYTGKIGADFANEFPSPVSSAMLARGQERFNIFCTPCHDRTGSGNGIVVQRGYRHPPSLHLDRLRAAPAGYLFDVITHGFGVMPDYAAQVPVNDRWAIVSYIRALQLSQHATLADVPAAEQPKLTQSHE